MDSVSIVIPIYNEEENLEYLIEEIQETLGSKIDFEIIAIDDYSFDKSYDLLKRLKNKYNIKIFKNSQNLGQSMSIKRGIDESSRETIVTIDADLQNNPKDILRLIKIYFENDYSLVGGIRNKRKDKIIKILSSKIANVIRSSILKDKCKDTGCSLKIFSKLVFQNFIFFDGIHRFLPAMFSGYGYKTYFVNVDHRPRIKGYSKYGIYNRFFKGIYDIYRVYFILKKIKKEKIVKFK